MDSFTYRLTSPPAAVGGKGKNKSHRAIHSDERQRGTGQRACGEERRANRGGRVGRRRWWRGAAPVERVKPSAPSAACSARRAPRRSGEDGCTDGGERRRRVWPAVADGEGRRRRGWRGETAARMARGDGGERRRRVWAAPADGDGGADGGGDGDADGEGRDGGGLVASRPSLHLLARSVKTEDVVWFNPGAKT
ncbi:hypothetical protein DAI22_11g024900 [Oryza sativa Japonica Group]|jgi:hypothetical protein|nr:hypothetical protein DAI22_11g024900 [Oryza sativa Japonica Group]